ncbi:hypothetical protein PoB_006512500 [Plakobranchus ocellatus]|uniref:Uncharacterized protein n=1 Tax=Plakobranchus ocellatus TaxID=259542 RepID=A0AAV4D3A6_9GAST|nr:hypothetical protein PoB_006512500 [Plakobranchus ocellatus]
MGEQNLNNGDVKMPAEQRNKWQNGHLDRINLNNGDVKIPAEQRNNSKHQGTRSGVMIVFGMRHSGVVWHCLSRCLYFRQELRDLTIDLVLELGFGPRTSHMVANCPTS